MPNINKIPALAIFPVRQAVLREGKPLDTCYFDGDDLATTTHFGLFLADNLVGILSVFKKNNALFAEKNQMQIRGMAVLKPYQGMGFGQKLVVFCEEFCGSDCDLIWFNARKEAVGFYEN